MWKSYVAVWGQLLQTTFVFSQNKLASCRDQHNSKGYLTLCVLFPESAWALCCGCQPCTFCSLSVSLQQTQGLSALVLGANPRTVNNGVVLGAHLEADPPALSFSATLLPLLEPWEPFNSHRASQLSLSTVSSPLRQVCKHTLPACSQLHPPPLGVQPAARILEHDTAPSEDNGRTQLFFMRDGLRRVARSFDLNLIHKHVFSFKPFSPMVGNGAKY